jgi:hypothetical protein
MCRSVQCVDSVCMHVERQELGTEVCVCVYVQVYVQCVYVCQPCGPPGLIMPEPVVTAADDHGGVVQGRRLGIFGAQRAMDMLMVQAAT